MKSQRDTVRASLERAQLAEDHNGVYINRRGLGRRYDDVKAAPMRPSGVRKMRQSRKRRKAER